MTRARTDVNEIGQDLVDDLNIVKSLVTDGWTKPMSDDAVHAIARLETFAAIALRVMAKTNPSKIRDVARTVEIQARIHGKEVLEDE